MTTASTIPEYIAGYDDAVAERLQTIYAMVRGSVPADAVETVKWRMPAFMQGSEPLFFFTGAKKHVSFYPGEDALAQFADRLSEYSTTQHAVQFPHNRPLPTDLIAEIIAWRVSDEGTPC